MSKVAKSNTTLYLNIIGTAGRGAAPVSRKQPTRGRAAREELITVSASHLIIIVRSSPPRREIREPPWCFFFFFSSALLLTWQVAGGWRGVKKRWAKLKREPPESGGEQTNAKQGEDSRKSRRHPHVTSTFIKEKKKAWMRNH